MGRVRNLTVSTVLYPLEQSRIEMLLTLGQWSPLNIHGFGADISLDFHVTAAVVGLSLRREHEAGQESE